MYTIAYTDTAHIQYFQIWMVNILQFNMMLVTKITQKILSLSNETIIIPKHEQMSTVSKLRGCNRTVLESEVNLGLNQ